MAIGLCKYHCSGDQLVSMALLEIKNSSSDTNEFLLIYTSSTARFKTSFLTSVTTCASHHHENWAWISPKINGAEKTWASEGSTLCFPIHTWIHKGMILDIFFYYFHFYKCFKIYFLPYTIFSNSTIERILRRRGNWRQSHYILRKPQIARIAVSKYCT